MRPGYQSRERDPHVIRARATVFHGPLSPLAAVLDVPTRLHALSNLAMVPAAATRAALFPSLVPALAILIGVPLIGRYLTQSSWPG